VNCQDIQKFAYTFLDREFDDRDQAEFQTHLGMCPPCRDTVERDASFRDAVRRHLTPTCADPDIRQGVHRRLREAHQKARMSRTVAIPLALAASMALAVLSWQALRQGNVDDSLVAVVVTPSPVAMVAAPTPAPTPVNTPAVVVKTPVVLPVPRVSDDVKLVAEQHQPAQVMGGSLNANAMARRSPFGAIRSPANLRAMVRSHVQPLPPEVRGRAEVVQRFLSERLPYVGPPPIADGVGVQLHGARLTRFAGRPVVHYYYQSYGKPLTVFRFVRIPGEEPFEDPEVERASPGDPNASTDGALLDQLAGYSILHSLRGGELTCLVSELGGDELHALIRAPTML